eukprot:5485089-Amphidinium_carterae.1
MLHHTASKEFPLCSTYWRKLYDLRAVQVGVEEASTVFEEAVAVSGSCVELWEHYLQVPRSGHLCLSAQIVKGTLYKLQPRT